MAPGSDRRTFWRDVFALHGAVTPKVLPRILAFGIVSVLVMALRHSRGGSGLEVGPVELVGVILGLLMVLRTNAGYDRWWEGRKLWGGIVNQCRDLVIAALAYAPAADREWRRGIACWTASFAHACRRSLRGQRVLPEIAQLVGPEAAGRIARADHMPGEVSTTLAQMLQGAVDKGWLSPFGLLRCDEQRSVLIDHVGGCERILRAPLPVVYVIAVRRFVTIYLLVLPFSLVDRVGWATPILTMLVAYPMLGLDQISFELENPFASSNLGHLPLEAICGTIESNVLALADGTSGEEPRAPSEPAREERPERELLAHSEPAKAT
jgi:putative membrane protein